MVIIRL